MPKDCLQRRKWAAKIKVKFKNDESKLSNK